MKCVCVWLGAGWELTGLVDERIGFGLRKQYYQCNLGTL